MQRAHWIPIAAAALLPLAAFARDPADCTGLVPPALPQPVEVTFGDPNGESCTVYGSDGQGTALFGYQLNGGQGAGVQLFYSVDGSRIASAQIFGLGPAVPQQSGFLCETFQESADYQSYRQTLLGISHAGAITNVTTLHDGPGGGSSTTLLYESAGGAVALTGEGNGASWQLTFQRVDTSGARIVGPLALESGAGQLPGFAAQTEVDGSLLLLRSGASSETFRNNQLIARWFDPNGAPTTSWFMVLDQVLFASYSTFNRQGRDSSTVVTLDNQWALLKPGSAAVAPAPAPTALDNAIYLRDRILVPKPSPWGGPTCQMQYAVYAPAGNACGTVTIPITPSGGYCLTDRVSLGLDGTVFQSSPAATRNDCQVRWYPGLFH